MFTFLPRVFTMTFDFNFVYVLLWDEWIVLLFFDFDSAFYNKRLIVNHQRNLRTPADLIDEPCGLQRSVIWVNHYNLLIRLKTSLLSQIVSSVVTCLLFEAILNLNMTFLFQTLAWELPRNWRRSFDFLRFAFRNQIPINNP